MAGFTSIDVQRRQFAIMTDFVTVAKVSDISSGQGQAFAVNGRMVAVFNEEGKFSAIDDFCPHMGASLAGGYLEAGIVTCPWHAWRFCISPQTGRGETTRKSKSTPSRSASPGEEIQVRVPPPMT